MKIGVFDSGLGGLTVLHELKQSLPKHDYIYLGDNARYPYGNKGEETIKRYARECADFLLINQNVDLIVIACNTASAMALGDLTETLKCPVIGTIEPAVRVALSTTKCGRIGIIGTDAMISSGAYQNSLAAINAKIEVFTRSCPLFVPLVENGMTEGEIVDKIVEFYLADLVKENVDTIILACTHYPLLISAIKKFVGVQIQLVECSKAIAQDVEKLIGSGESENASNFSKFFTTDEVGRFNYLASTFLEEQGICAEKVILG